MKNELENIIEMYDVQTNDDVQFRKDLIEQFNKNNADYKLKRLSVDEMVAFKKLIKTKH